MLVDPIAIRLQDPNSTKRINWCKGEDSQRREVGGVESVEELEHPDSFASRGVSSACGNLQPHPLSKENFVKRKSSRMPNSLGLKKPVSERDAIRD